MSCKRKVCCGGQHAAVLTDCGEIFTWGRGGFGRLGHGNREVVDSPKRIEALAGVPCVQVHFSFCFSASFAFFSSCVFQVSSALSFIFFV